MRNPDYLIQLYYQGSMCAVKYSHQFIMCSEVFSMTSLLGVCLQPRKITLGHSHACFQESFAIP